MNSLLTKSILCAGLAILLSGLAARADDALAIVVNVASKLDNVSSSELERYFKAEKTKTPDGTKLVIAMHAPGRPEREAALKYIYKMSEDEYTNFFVEATFTGAVSSAPKAFPSPGAVKKFIAATPGAISYLRESDVDATVKAVKVDGKPTSDPAYPLKVK